MNDIIEKCLSLEKDLSQYRLCGNLIPPKSWHANLREVLTRKEWKIIRDEVIRKSNNKCNICNVKNIKLEAHEEWKYIYMRNQFRN